MVPSSAVTFTLMTVLPTTSVTWWPSAVLSASDESRYSTVASESDFSSVTVTWPTPFAADAS